MSTVNLSLIRPPEVNFSKLTDGRSLYLQSTPTIELQILIVCFGLISIILGHVLLFLLKRGILDYEFDCKILFMNLTIADILTAIGYFGSTVYHLKTDTWSSNDVAASTCSHSMVCEIQSFVTTSSSMASFLWTVVIEGYCFFMVLGWRRTLLLSMRSFVAVHIVCWGFPIALTASAWLRGVLGPARYYTTGGWCWISSCTSNASRLEQFLWMLFTGKMWEFLVYITIINLILLGFFFSNRKRRKSTDFTEVQRGIETAHFTVFPSGFDSRIARSSKSNVTPATVDLIDKDEQLLVKQKLLFWIPVMLMFARIWGTTRFTFDSLAVFHQTVPPSLTDVNTVLLYMQGIGDTSQATCNFFLALIFCKAVRNFLFFRQNKKVENYSVI